MRSEQETLALGAYCETLLSDEFFNQLVREYELSTFQNFQSSAPSDVAGREALYHEFNGVSTFIASMANAVEARDNLLKPAAPSSDDDAFDAG